MAKNIPARPADSGAPGRRSQGRLGLVALVLAVLALPAALFPWVGLVIGVVVLLVALVALIVALRSAVLSRSYPMIAVALAIVAVALAGVVTNSTAQVLQDCESTSGDELRQCLEDRRTGDGE
jgi:O-antigen ligase